MNLTQAYLSDQYLKKRQSVAEIAKRAKCSERKVNYWLSKYNIPKRSISEAIYLKSNPNGDPFVFNEPANVDEAFLYGLGIGLYWGEGNKKNKHVVRLGNTDPRLVKKFLEFLYRIYDINKDKLRFGLQVFSDIPPSKARKFWEKELDVKKSQFQKVIVTPARGIGSYRQKTKHGVLTVYYGNKKLRDIICGVIEKMQ